jgi:hypothetical protein
VFPVRYELKFVYYLDDYEGSHSHQRVKCGHESRGTRNQESLYWRGPAAI